MSDSRRQIGLNWWSGLAAIGMLIFFTLGAGYAYLASKTPPWPKPIPGVRLEPMRPHLARGHLSPTNAWYHIQKLEDLVQQHSVVDVQEEWQSICTNDYSVPASTPALDAAWEEQAAALVAYRDAARCTFAQRPSPDADEFARANLWQPLLSMAKLLGHAAFVAAGRGNWQETDACTREVLQVSDHTSRGGPAMAGYMAVATRGIILSRMLLIADVDQPPDAILRGWIARLREQNANCEPMAETVRYDRLAVQATLLDNAWTGRHFPAYGKLLQHSGLGALVGSTPRRTTAHLDALFTHIIATAEKPYDRVASVPFLQGGHVFEPWAMLIDDPVGRLYAYMMLAGYETQLGALLRGRVQIRGTATALATILHEREHGQAPPSLDAIAPVCGAEMLIDPLSIEGTSRLGFSHLAEGESTWRLYSVGVNQKDEGGWRFCTDCRNNGGTMNRMKGDIVLWPTERHHRHGEFPAKMQSHGSRTNGAPTTATVPRP